MSSNNAAHTSSVVGSAGWGPYPSLLIGSAGWGP